MNDIQLLARVIGQNDLAERLLRRFGGLRKLLHADAAALATEPGIGDSRSALLRALPELARRYFEESLPVGEAIRSPADTQAFLHAKIRHLGHEMFCCLYLDNRHRVLRFDQLFRGTIDGTSVYPREVVKEGRAHYKAAKIRPRAGRYPTA
jgi:DNA repair protein RadC